MPDRPRTVWIGTDTPFVLEQFRNEKTGQLIEGITTGTMQIYSGVDDSLIATLNLTELVDELGSYEVLVPDDQTGLVEGMALRLQFEISGGAGLSYRLDARATARVRKDDGL
jgi:sulfur transfer protein SufE